MNPIRWIHDYRAKKEEKRRLMALLKKQPPGMGIQVPRGGVGAAAVMELLKEYPRALTVTIWDSGVVLMKTREFDTISAALKASMAEAGAIANPGDDLNE